jgi:two-component system chemotaxis response regulator CheY
MNNEVREERRKYIRVAFREDILIDGTKTCSTMDISKGGLYISTIQPYEVDTLIKVTIPLKKAKLTVKAVVCHCQPGVGMGVKFLNLNAQQEAKIEELINSLKEEDVQAQEAKNILIVEDNKTAREAIKNALLKKGFNVIEANDGIQALKLLADQPPDLLILDLHMMGMDGLKMLSLLKSDSKWKEIPVIVCSAHDKQEVKNKVIKAGAEEFISKKGLTPTKLAQYAKAVLERHNKL